MMIIVMTCMLLRIVITMKLFIMILVFNWIMLHMIVILLILLPRLFMRRILLMWKVVKFICLCIMKIMLYVMVILLNSSMILLKIIMREEHMLVGIAIISSFLSMCFKFWSYACFTFLCLLIIVPISCLLTKSLCIGSGLDLNVLVIFFMMLPLCFNSYLLCEHHCWKNMRYPHVWFW